MSFVESENSNSQKLEDYLKERKSPDEFMWKSSENEAHLKNQLPWLALVGDEEVVAFVLFTQTEDIFEILYLESHPQKLRQGYMNQLMDEFIRKAQGREIWLDVHEANRPAQELYKKWGFYVGG
ncbi:MAG: GNAT family N-acetyltransferase, partial [Bdellovibrionales bacterium]|nr:GNAT family N-acetyltransferase [Bdellovibrionales bacterium]